MTILGEIILVDGVFDKINIYQEEILKNCPRTQHILDKVYFDVRAAQNKYPSLSALGNLDETQVKDLIGNVVSAFFAVEKVKSDALKNKDVRLAKDIVDFCMYSEGINIPIRFDDALGALNTDGVVDLHTLAAKYVQHKTGAGQKIIEYIYILWDLDSKFTLAG